MKPARSETAVKVAEKAVARGLARHRALGRGGRHFLHQLLHERAAGGRARGLCAARHPLRARRRRRHRAVRHSHHHRQRRRAKRNGALDGARGAEPQDQRHQALLQRLPRRASARGQPRPTASSRRSRIAGHAVFTETVRFYPTGSALPRLVDGEGDYAFRLQLNTAAPPAPIAARPAQRPHPARATHVPDDAALDFRSAAGLPARHHRHARQGLEADRQTPRSNRTASLRCRTAGATFRLLDAQEPCRGQARWRLSEFTQSTVGVLRSAGARLDRPDDADGASRRHRARALGQDRVHHRARAQPDRRRTAAVLRRHGRGPHRRAPIWSRSPTIACRALPTRSIWPISPATRRNGPRARGASASSASPSSMRRGRPLRRALTAGRLHVDIVDYPGEWLIDLPLLDLRLRRLVAARGVGGARQAASGRGQGVARIPLHARSRCAGGRADRAQRRRALHPLPAGGPRARSRRLSAPGPGRFLLPGDLAGSPLLTFFPLPAGPAGSYARGTLGAMLERRFESYKAHVVKPFFRDHFARLDRQIVLIDALSAINAGAGRAAPTCSARSKPSSSASGPGPAPGCRASCRAASTACCSPPPRPTTCTTPATTGSRPSCACIADKAIARAEFAGAEVKVVALAALQVDARSRGALGLAAAALHRRRAAARRAAGTQGVRWHHGGGRLSRRPAGRPGRRSRASHGPTPCTSCAFARHGCSSTAPRDEQAVAAAHPARSGHGLSSGRQARMTAPA